MANSPTAAYYTLLADIQAGRLAPVYLLQGQEPYFIEQLTQALAQNIVPAPEASDFDLVSIFGADTTVAQIVDNCRQFPIMGDKRAVIVRETQGMRNAKAELDKLIPYINKPAQTTVLVMAWKAESLRSTSKVVRAVKGAGGVVFDSPKIKEWQVPSLISDYCTRLKINMDRGAAEMLRDSIGADLSRLFSEIDKLLIACKGCPITPGEVQRHIGISKEFNNYELINALAAKNYGKAQQIIHHFEANPKNNPVIVTTAVLFRFFSQLIMAHYSPDKTERGLMGYLGLSSPYALKEIKRGTSNYSPGSCMRILHAVRELDAGSKGIGSQQGEFALLYEFLYKAFTL